MRPDKKKHLLVGAVIGLVVSACSTVYFILNGSLPLNILFLSSPLVVLSKPQCAFAAFLMGTLIASIFGLWKEYFMDKNSGGEGTCDKWDAVATIIGGAVGSLVGLLPLLF